MAVGSDPLVREPTTRSRQPPAKAEPQLAESHSGAVNSDDSARCALLLVHRNLLIEADRVISLVAQLPDAPLPDAKLADAQHADAQLPDARELPEVERPDDGVLRRKSRRPSKQPSMLLDSSNCPQPPSPAQFNSRELLVLAVDDAVPKRKRSRKISTDSGDFTKSTPVQYAKSMSEVDPRGARKALYATTPNSLSQTFEIYAGLAIISSSILNGVEVQYQSRNLHEELPLAFTIVRHLFTLLFLGELGIRMRAIGLRQFFCHKDERLWALLDCFVVATSLFELGIDVLIQLAASDTRGLPGQTVLRNARLARMVRTARAFRLQRIIRFVNPLRTLVYSIMGTLKSLWWAMVLLVTIMYMFGLAFTMEAVDFIQTEHLNSNHADTVMELQAVWGSLDRSMYTLFESISGGVSWHEVERPLERISLLPAILFTIYIGFVYFAVLNTVTGVFCSSAIETTQRNPELVARSIIDKRVTCSDKLQALFGAIDDDGSGLITMDELEIIANDELVRAYFQALEIDFRDAYTLFKLIDVDKSGAIKKDDFLAGCEKLRGGATSMELAELGYDVKRLARQVDGMRDLIKKSTTEMKDILQNPNEQTNERTAL